MKFLFLLQLQWILVAPGILAEPNVSVGQAAYDRCIRGEVPAMTSTPIPFQLCEINRVTAIREDAEVRFKLLFADLAAGRIRSQATLNTYLAKYKLAQQK